MVTICSFCGKQLEEKEDETFCICHNCNKFTPKGANSYNPNKTVEDEEKKPKVKKERVKKESTGSGVVILQMIKEGKNNEEIMKEIPCKESYIKMIRYKLNKGILQ